MNIEEIKELIEKKQFTKLKEELKEMKSADISTILDELDKEQAVIIFRLLSKEKAGMTFSYMETDMREKLIKDLTDTELKNVLDELFMDDTVDLIEEMPSNVVTRILRNVDKNDRKVINELLKYPEDSAGSIMTTEFIDLKENMTIEQALDRIRQIGTDSETIYTCYVLDQNRKLQGIISIKELILAKEESLIADNMETNIISVNTLEDKEEVARKVGVGAIIFNDLSNSRIKDEIFDWDMLLNFQGETGPYIQYIYVRTRSLLNKAGYMPKIEEIDFSKINEKEALDTLKLIYQFNDVIKSAAEKNEPSILARYLIDLSQSFSTYYNEHRIITEDKDVQNARLFLTYSVDTVLKTGAELLGMEMPERM